MKRKFILISLALMPGLTHAQVRDRCSDIVALPKELYDSFQLVQNNLHNADNDITKYRESHVELLKKYLGCENQPDVAAIFKQTAEWLAAAEN